jgi:site-specific recombinase XerD
MPRMTQLSQSSSQALREDYSEWVAWCCRHRFRAMPADPRHIAAWLIEMHEKEIKLATIRRRLWAIGRRHFEAGFTNPTMHIVVFRTLARIAEDSPPPRKAEILSDADIRAMLETQADTVIGRRNRALLAVAVSVQLQRNELVGIDWTHVDIVEPARARIAANFRWIPLSAEAGFALEDWHTELRAVEILHGPVFRAVDRHGNIGGRLAAGEVNRIFKSMARLAELDKVEITSRSVLRASPAARSATGSTTAFSTPG